jgi:hypothetical protein
MAAARDEVEKILRPLGRGFGRRDAQLIEAECTGLLGQPGLQICGCLGLAQKSRST